MKSKYFALGACALALTACDMLGGPKQVTIGPNSTDEQKFAYMLGAQFGGQNFTMIPRQVGAELYEDEVVQGIYDNIKAEKDTTFKMQVPADSMQAIGARFSAKARERMEKMKPDSAAIANINGDHLKMQAYMDSMSKAMPVEAAPAPTRAPVTLGDAASDNQKFSYMIGVQFGAQFQSIGKQFNTEFDADYFVLGVRESAAKVRDTTKTMTLPEDSLKAVGERFNEKMKVIREEAIKKQQEEQKKLEAEVAELKGETLANGMPAKINFKVKATGISTKAENLEAYAGKPLLMFYFSATCGHCAHAAPQLVEIAKEFNPKGLTSVAIASGGNNKSGIRRFSDDAKFEGAFDVLWDESRQFGELYSDGYVPKVYLVNPDGSYKLYAAFEREKEDLKKEIAELLNGKPVEWKVEAPAVDTAKVDTPAVAQPAPAKADASTGSATAKPAEAKPAEAKPAAK
ncbi:MAG: redoxin domain-containing protein [Fibrobacter sp.]|nr:redoxin domain-containing protein [Fibrobacter sp.]